MFVLVPLVVAILTIGSLMLWWLERKAELRLQTDVALVARALQVPMARALEQNRRASVELDLQSALRISRVYGAYVYDDTGHVIATAGNVTMDRQLKSSILRVVASGQRGGEFNRMGNRSVYSYFAPLKNDRGKIIGLLQVTRRKEDFRQSLKALQVRAAICLLLGAALLIGIVLAGYQGAVGRALNRLRHSMSRVESGDYQHRAAICGPREIATLAQGMNAMLDSIVEARKEIQIRRAAEDDLERKLHCSEKLASLGRVAAGVAHELGAPLSLIDGKAQRAMRRPENAAADLMREIRQQVGRMERLVRQMLEFGRPGSLERKRVRADELAALTRRHLSETDMRGWAAVEFHGPRPGPELCVDPFRVEQALNNLLQNARQAAPDGTVQLFWEESGNSVVFSVADSGPGVPSGMKAAIFDPFFTTRKSAKGVGLGLTVVRQVVNEHQARIEVCASAMGGAEFRLIFPRAAEQPHFNAGSLETTRKIVL